ncbi:hypothetical protein CGRA01v4_13430 [Colletotrichum graminicola]|nr:hypothetical protein CGRA01v4_13430 [Colletotrichum graminicola]
MRSSLEQRTVRQADPRRKVGGIPGGRVHCCPGKAFPSGGSRPIRTWQRTGWPLFHFPPQ